MGTSGAQGGLWAHRCSIITTSCQNIPSSSCFSVLSTSVVSSPPSSCPWAWRGDGCPPAPHFPSLLPKNFQVGVSCGQIVTYPSLLLSPTLPAYSPFLQWSQLWGPCRALQCYFCHGSWGFQSPWRSSFQILMSQFFDIVSLVNLSCIPLQLPSLLLLSWFLQLLVTQSQNAFVSNSLLHLPPQCLGSYLLAPQVQQFRSCMWDLQSVDSITSPFPPSLTTHGLHLAFYHVKIHS